jgi:hypothetical protein
MPLPRMCTTALVCSLDASSKYPHEGANASRVHSIVTLPLSAGGAHVDASPGAVASDPDNNVIGEAEPSALLTCLDTACLGVGSNDDPSGHRFGNFECFVERTRHWPSCHEFLSALAEDERARILTRANGGKAAARKEVSNSGLSRSWLRTKNARPCAWCRKVRACARSPTTTTLAIPPSFGLSNGKAHKIGTSTFWNDTDDGKSWSRAGPSRLRPTEGWGHIPMGVSRQLADIFSQLT